MDDVNVLQGYLARTTPELSVDEIEQKLCSDDVLKKGVLFAGSARQGKTNVMMKVTSDILNKLNNNDVALIFDVKGDYREAFYLDGDIVISPTENTFIWNIFDELKVIPFGNELDIKIREIVDYLYYGQASAKEPFWTNAAKIITYCLIMYLLLEADSNDDDSKLNHKELCNLIDGLSGDADDIYNNYLDVINSYCRFKSARLFLPPIDSGLMGPGVITEILVMRQRMFNASFGEKKSKAFQSYVSSGSIPELKGSKIIFLEFNQEYSATCIPVYRCIVDMLISEYLSAKNRNGGKLYLILDELALLPELDNLSRALSLGAGLGIRIVAALQDIEQIRHNYDKNPHNAEVLLNAFQSQIIFKSPINTLKYFQGVFGEALIQRIYIRPGGGLGYTEPVKANVVETIEMQRLDIGQAVVHFSSENAFIKRFPLYK